MSAETCGGIHHFAINCWRCNDRRLGLSLRMDVRVEPVVLTVPEMERKRFYHFQLIDLYTHNWE